MELLKARVPEGPDVSQGENEKDFEVKSRQLKRVLRQDKRKKRKTQRPESVDRDCYPSTMRYSRSKQAQRTE